MRMHCLYHVPFEDAAAIGDWAAAHGLVVSSGGYYAGDAPPPVEEVDWLVVMGGPMSTYDEHLHSWLHEEKTYIKAAIGQGKRVLGVCLGAQLVAETLGAVVGPNVYKEIGWLPVTLDKDAAARPLLAGAPSQFMAFHWHGDTFSTPPGAIPLGRSAGCVNQGFLYGDRVLGLQFHLESTPQSIEALIAHCAGDIVPGPFVQPPDVMRGGMGHIEDMRPVMNLLLSGLLTAGEGV